MDDENEEEQPRVPQKRSSAPRRSLFGSGRSEDTDEWLQGLEKKTMEEKVQKWNFDFVEDKPIEKSANNPDAPSPSHVYEAVDAKEVPAFYRSKTIVTEKVEIFQRITETPRKRRVRRVQSEQQSPQKVPVKPTMSVGQGEVTSPRKRLRREKPVMECTPQKRGKPEDLVEQGECSSSQK